VEGGLTKRDVESPIFSKAETAEKSAINTSLADPKCENNAEANADLLLQDWDADNV
jgi:hypothetical protein